MGPPNKENQYSVKKCYSGLDCIYIGYCSNYCGFPYLHKLAKPALTCPILWKKKDHTEWDLSEHKLSIWGRPQHKLLESTSEFIFSVNETSLAYLQENSGSLIMKPLDWEQSQVFTSYIVSLINWQKSLWI